MLAVLTPDNVDQWFEGQYSVIPPRMREAIVAYIRDGVMPGNFLTAVICNDLRNAVGHADEENLPLLKLYTQWFYNLAPSSCVGTRGNMNDWCHDSGLIGRATRFTALTNE